MDTLPATYLIERDGNRHRLYTTEFGEKTSLGSHKSKAKAIEAANNRERYKPTLANCVPEFQAKIAAIAALAGMTTEAVFTLWRKYSHDCSTGDQSAVLGEFVDWYAARLGGDKEALRAVA